MLRSAFSKEEQSFIPTVNVKADKNPENFFLDAGNPTQDKVYLLSIPEVKELLSSRPEIICFPTQYAKDRGCSMDEFNIFCWWWLRTPGGLIPGETAGVRSDGTVDWRGRSVNFDGGGVRPALWLDFTV